jgi:hypothetical protein
MEIIIPVKYPHADVVRLLRKTLTWIKHNPSIEMIHGNHP